MTNPLLGRLDLDDVLVKFKVFDRYHGVAVISLTVAYMFEFIWYWNHVIVAEKVGYRCKESTNISEISNTSYIPNQTVEWCRNPEACPEWVYDNPYSFVAEFQLACQDWKRTSVGSMHNIGYMFGLLTIGPSSDRFGRKTMAIVTCVAGGTLGCMKSFVRSYWLYVSLEFMEAAVGDTMSPVYMLGIEMVATKSRVTYSTIFMTGLGIGGIIFAFVSWLIPYWRTLLRVVYAPGLLALCFIYLLDESPRWLLTNGKKEEAVKIIEKAAKLNKMEIEENLNNISYEVNKGPSFVSVIRDTFKSRSLLKRFFVCGIWWASATFVNVGLIVNSTLLEGSKYINFGLSSAMKSLGILFSAYIITKYHRKGPLIFCFVACAVFCTGQPFLPKKLWLQITNYMVGLLLSCANFCIIYLFTSELFPTQSRNSMHALCSAVGRIGSILAPQTPLLMAYWSGLPTLLFGVVSLIAGLATLLVPDTADQCLPDTVYQAENMEAKILTESRS
ncbi:solute carrier family 22 member 3-like [Cydia splendana]|uniref:solute carrier family 22 member 3-like n=1 Tax=Cydia splendana TaxID=1100963 RepID=UPI00300C920C